MKVIETAAACDTDNFTSRLQFRFFSTPFPPTTAIYNRIACKFSLSCSQTFLGEFTTVNRWANAQLIWSVGDFIHRKKKTN
ncbi:hypothetical protein GDO78_010847 [Eleutherodactylus coqui]|uniref:Uncharacterized protein n=1 Tax=Eleutherodactylus coqui TaxID=57060 RepID=A0A8J6F4H7_ELECQ|nr:hypothetical protein GDO78_010847 [Eleutherodactylus coqui]